MTCRLNLKHMSHNLTTYFFFLIEMILCVLYVRVSLQPRILKKWISQPFDFCKIRQRDLHRIQTLLAMSKDFCLTVQDSTLFSSICSEYIQFVSDYSVRRRAPPSYRLSFNPWSVARLLIKFSYGIIRIKIFFLDT